MKLSVLFERMSSVVYHATTFPSAEKILQSDRLKQDEVSFTRSLSGAYHRKNKMIGVIFEFNGNRLNHNHKGGPVGTENFDYDYEVEYDPSTPKFKGRDNGQLEDRLYTKGGLENVTKYIVSAILYAPLEYVASREGNEFEGAYRDEINHIHNVISLLEKHKIPFRYVASETQLNNKRINDKRGFSEVIKHMYQNYDQKRDINTQRRFGITYDYNIEFINVVDVDDPMGGYETITRTIKAKSMDDAERRAKKAVEKTKSDNISLASITEISTGNFREY